MAEFTLYRCPTLREPIADVAKTRIEEITSARITTLSLPGGNEARANETLSRSVGCAMPDIGFAVFGRQPECRVLRLGIDRIMILETASSEVGGPDISEAGYCLDQSDYWVVFAISGPLTVPALERLCRLDLDSAQFPDNGVRRTIVGDMPGIMLRSARDRFLLLVPRSYARSLVETLTVSRHYVAD